MGSGNARSSSLTGGLMSPLIAGLGGQRLTAQNCSIGIHTPVCSLADSRLWRTSGHRRSDADLHWLAVPVHPPVLLLRRLRPSPAQQGGKRRHPCGPFEV